MHFILKIRTQIVKPKSGANAAAHCREQHKHSSAEVATYDIKTFLLQTPSFPQNNLFNNLTSGTHSHGNFNFPHKLLYVPLIMEGVNPERAHSSRISREKKTAADGTCAAKSTEEFK